MRLNVLNKVEVLQSKDIEAKTHALISSAKLYFGHPAWSKDSTHKGMYSGV
jgi:hypothetical protein